MKITVNSKLVIDNNLLDNILLSELKDVLLVSLQLYSGEEKIFSFFKEEGGKLFLPRGFIDKLLSGLHSSGIDFEIIDNRKFDYLDNGLKEIQLRPHQAPAVIDILNNEQGVYQAPPGSGKTVTALEAARRAGGRVIILVDKASIADQWRDRASSLFKVKTGFIGGGKMEEELVTVAIKQTLWSKKDQLKKEGFFDKWDFVIFDECHHITADSYQLIVQEFSAKYLLGISATPNMNKGLEKVVKFLLGDIIHITNEEDLIGENILLRPKVTVVPTKFDKQFFKKGNWNNYQQILKSLCNDKDRNLLIAKQIMKRKNKNILVASRRLDQLNNIEAMLKSLNTNQKIIRLTGKENEKEREEVINLSNKYNCVLLSTVANEALDIPNLDCLFLVFPTSKGDLLKQLIGRIERFKENKDTPEIIDINDINSNILFNQFYNRMVVYKEKNLDISYQE